MPEKGRFHTGGNHTGMKAQHHPTALTVHTHAPQAEVIRDLHAQDPGQAPTIGISPGQDPGADPCPLDCKLF